MKRFLLVLGFLAFLTGCSSGNDKAEYKLITLPQLQAKVRKDLAAFETTFNKWKYAGSDPQYDYIYEYKPGIFPVPNGEFEYFKLDTGQILIKTKYDFDPDVRRNHSLFE